MNLIADEVKLNNDAIALLLIDKIKDNVKYGNTNLYYNFPFYRGELATDVISAQVLFVSQEYGVLCFRCLSSEDDYNDTEKTKIDALDSYIYAKLTKREELRKERRTLKIKVSPYVFINGSVSGKEDIVSLDNIDTVILNNKAEKLSDTEFNVLIATIEGTTNFIRKSDRETDETTGNRTKGKVLNEIQAKESVFDSQQKRAALNIIDSPQRIRGLAGSGKTVILAMKAALYHLQNPEEVILYTYFTKALYGQVKYLIDKFYRDFSENKEPNWNKINIIHAWGGVGLKGVYSDTCFENSITPISFSTAKIKRSKYPFEYIFEELDKYALKQKYDLTLIDEGQDFNKHFYRVCRKITKKNRIVWAYDDFQNIFDVEMQDEKETFGKDDTGNFYVDFSQNINKLQDIVLYKCYRNSRFVLISAFALGLGIYNDRVLQRLENNKHWEDLGFKVVIGDSSDNADMIIERPQENSPIEMEEKNSICINTFENLDEETDFIANAVENDIRKENLNSEDICVICLDNKNINKYFEYIEKKLLNKQIKAFSLLKASNSNKRFTYKGYVTLSTINRAKGNEVGMVYIVGVDNVFTYKDDIQSRNKLFTAITRSKGWVHLTGIKEKMMLCRNELDVLKYNAYKLIFRQPSSKDTKTIKLGMSRYQAQLNEMGKKLEKISMESGIPIEDILKTFNAKK